MKCRIGSDLSAAIEKSCRCVFVDRYCCDEKAGCIGGGADIADFGVLHIYIATLVQPIIASSKRNRINNFTGNSLSHFITPTITIVADSRGEIKGNLAWRAEDGISVVLRVIIFAMERFYRTRGGFIMDNY